MIAPDFAPNLVEAVSEPLRRGLDPDPWAVARALSNVVTAGTLPSFVATELERIGKRPEHRTEGVVSQTTLAIHRDEDWEYVISLVYPDQARTPRHIWSGHTDILVSEHGVAYYAVHGLPLSAQRKSFDADISATQGETGRFFAGRPVLSDGRRFVEVWGGDGGADIVHIVTLKDRGTRAQWVFDRSLRAVHAEAASITESRLVSILDVYDATEQPYPDLLLTRCLATDSPRVPVELVSRLLVRNDARAFSCLERMIRSDDAEISVEGQRFFDYLLTRGGADAA